MNNEQQEIEKVLSFIYDPKTIRKQAQALLELAKQDKLSFFTLNSKQMNATASFVTEVIQEQYPDLNIPYHSRWRHFEAGGTERITKLQRHLRDLSLNQRGKILYELVIISVLLDAGAGASWRYSDPETGKEFSRSEGLALASLALYQSGIFSTDPKEPLRIDAAGLLHLDAETLSKAFQVSPSNPLAGLEGRVTLLNQLGRTIQDKPQYFGKEERLGDFYCYVISLAVNNQLPVKKIFQAVLQAFNTIWPARLQFQGMPLGDVGMHHSLKNDNLGSEYIPFHKLSQWLTYSLLEPLELAGMKITHLEALTGLPEYRNGGLLLDMGLLQIKNPALLVQAHEPNSELVVEWRGLTVALLDELAVLVRKNLQKNTNELPLAKILQGGTWEAGRRIARKKRSQGTPPIQIVSDGTVF